MWLNLDEALEDLKLNIMSGHNKDKFRVYPIETAGGKTFITIDAIRDYYVMVKDNPFIENIKRTFIVVTKFKEEGFRISQEINKDMEEQIASFYTPDKKYKNDNNCNNNFYNCTRFNTIIITHSTYLNICNRISDEHKKYYNILKEYKTLIIDEEINVVKDSLYEFTKSEARWSKILTYFSKHQLAENFDNYINPLLKCLDVIYKKNNNQLHRLECEYCREEINHLYINLKDGVKEINKERFEDYRVDFNDNSCIKQNLVDVLDKIYNLYNSIDNNIALINPSRAIYSYNHNFNYLMIENNIWLDASASFFTMYQDNKLFEVVKCEREIDHSNSNFIFHIENTNTYTKNNDNNFRKNISKYIKTNYKEDKKTLILSKKAECIALAEKDEYLGKYDYSFLNFEEMRGIDSFKDFENCLYIHTYRLNPAYYVFLYEYFNYINFDDKELIVSNKYINYGKDKHSKIEDTKICWGFENKNLYRLMTTDIASSMYQALKRIQRNRNPKGIFEVFTNCIDAIYVLLDQFKGIDKHKNVKIIKSGETNYSLELAKEEKEPERAKLLKYIKMKYENEDKWTSMKSIDVMKELNIKNRNWNKIWTQEDFLNEMKSLRLKQRKMEDLNSNSKRKVNFIVKY